MKPTQTQSQVVPVVQHIAAAVSSSKKPKLAFVFFSTANPWWEQMYFYAI